MTRMSVRPILIHPDPRLKKVATAVPDLSDELRALAEARTKEINAAYAQLKNKK